MSTPSIEASCCSGAGCCTSSVPQKPVEPASTCCSSAGPSMCCMPAGSRDLDVVERKAVSPSATYGRRLTTDEYEAAIVALHTGVPAMPSKAQETELRRKELELSIDHRLGTEFPADKRQAMWGAAQRLERTRKASAVLMGAMVLVGAANTASGWLAHAVKKEFGKVLSRDELKAYLSDG